MKEATEYYTRKMGISEDQDLSLEDCNQIEMLHEFYQEQINTPEIDDFIKAVKVEAAHQTEKWGAEEEAKKYHFDYALVLDKLKGKQAIAIWDRNAEKYKHHLITMAAVCHNVHRQIEKKGTALHRCFYAK